LVRYPLGLPYNLLADISQHGKLYVIVSSGDQGSCHSSLSSNGVNMNNVIYINASTNTVWVRDYAPWFVFDDQRELRVVDFKYNRNRPSDNAIPGVIANALGYEYHYLPLVATGGNMMTDGCGKMMSTTLVLDENDGDPNTGGGNVTEYSYTQAEIENLVENYLGVSEYQFYQDPNGTYIDHIDCWAKLLDVDKVMIRSVPTSHAQYAAIEASVASGRAKPPPTARLTASTASTRPTMSPTPTASSSTTTSTCRSWAMPTTPPHCKPIKTPCPATR
jgi:agmatine/peptidylarginine deiminase